MQTPQALRPVRDLLPEAVQRFLDAGGWVVVGAGLALIGLLLLLWVARQLLAGRRRRGPPQPDLTEVLADYPPPPALWGTKRLTIHGLPVRIRLIVAAPLGTEGGSVQAEGIDAMLDLIVPGISDAIRADRPRVRIWPTQLSWPGFTAAFRRHAVRPDPESPLSRWVLLMGRALINQRLVALGFAFLADQENSLHYVTLNQPHQWMEVLRMRK